MSDDLEKMATSIFDNFVPKSWTSAGVGHLSLKPLASWIEDLNERIAFLKNWFDNGTPNVFWISGFFFPQAFLTATMQNCSRGRKIAIDTLSFRFIIRDDIKYTEVTEKPTDGCYCYGMYLEGCKWSYDNHRLAESDPKKLFVELPLLHLEPVQDRVVPITDIFLCPLYKVLSRSGTLLTTGHSTNFVCFMEIPSGDEPDKWIKAGVACFLALKY